MHRVTQNVVVDLPERGEPADIETGPTSGASPWVDHRSAPLEEWPRRSVFTWEQEREVGRIDIGVHRHAPASQAHERTDQRGLSGAAFSADEGDLSHDARRLLPART
jgi:hypothetical protein